ncbi:MAG: phosphoadenylyl-sulfate reductase [Alphaproteobacteria bacterium]
MTGATIDLGHADGSARPPGRARWAGLRAAALERAYPNADGAELLRAMVEVEFPGRIAVASSFGAEAAVLLALVADVDPAIPVIVLDTGKLFSETHGYIRRLTDRLGLGDVRLVRPDPERLAEADPGGTLWSRDPETCCRLRKVEPLRKALEPFEAWVSGRKRLHGEARAATPTIGAVDGHVVVSPLARWTQTRIDAVFAERALPRHPLAFEGYTSIGCRPCTRPVEAGAGPRAGRWPGTEKTECGIHRPALF